MKVVVSIGGSVLAPDDPERVAEHARVLQRLREAGHTVAVVVGGGSTAGEYIGTARELGANEMELDEIGIATTRLNARLLIAALGEAAIQTPPEDYEGAGAALRRGEVAVMGGVAPAQTTDAVSAALAEYVGADLLVFATNVAGVYDDDPNENPDAERYGELDARELVRIVSDGEMNAGAAAPVDLLAAKVIERSGMRSVVVDGTEPENVYEAVASGAHDGTDVVPENGGDDPEEWAE